MNEKRAQILAAVKKLGKSSPLQISDATGISSSYTPYCETNTAGAATLDNIIMQTTDAFSAADGCTAAAVVTSGAGMRFNLTRGITLKNAAGKSSSGATSGHDIVKESRYSKHWTQQLTEESSGTLNFMTNAVQTCQTGAMLGPEDSILYCSDAGRSIISHGIEAYANSSLNNGEQATNGTLNLVSDGSGNSSTVLKFTGGTTNWETDARWNFAAISAYVVVVDTMGVSGSPPVGEFHAVTSNTANTVTTAGFTGTVFNGVKFSIVVVNQVDPTTIRNNAYSGCATNGKNFDALGQPIADIVAVDGFCFNAATISLGSIAAPLSIFNAQAGLALLAFPSTTVFCKLFSPAWVV